MAENRRPPVSIEQWLKQVADDPSIPPEFKNGAEDQIKLTSTSFSSGSVVKASESLRMRVVWHKSRSLEALGSMMTDDPKHGYTGYVSTENKSEAGLMFNTKRSSWQPYFKELKMREDKERAADKKKRSRTRTAEPEQSDNGEAVPPWPQQHRPTKECTSFRKILYWQRLGLTEVQPGVPSEDELEQTSSISKSGPGRELVAGPTLTAVNQPVTPLKTNLYGQSVQDTAIDGFQSTPQQISYYPARGGKSNTPAADESYINTALLLLLQNITLEHEVEFSRMDWLATRLPFHLTEKVTTINTDTGEDHTTTRKLMEARVDGYLCCKSSPLQESLNADAVAIIEAKPYTRSSAHSTIKRQEGAEMACWISQTGDSKTGLLRSSSSGRKRRLMISQDRHEIYVIVGEYGAGFENHIRPSSLILQGSDMSQNKAGKSGLSIAESIAEGGSSSAHPDTTADRRDPGLLAGSPSYLKRMESKSIIVEAGKKTLTGQPIQPGPETGESNRTQQQWFPDAGDFLIMNEFGPFITTNPGHMEVLIRRLIALMLELRGPQDRFVPEPLSMNFLHQDDQAGPSMSNVSPSRPRRNLRKSRSWPAEHERLTRNWVKPSAMPKWRG